MHRVRTMCNTKQRITGLKYAVYNKPISSHKIILNNTTANQ